MFFISLFYITFFVQVSMNKVHSMRSSGSLNTAGKVAFLPDDSHFLKDTDNSGRAHTMAGRGDSHAPLNWVAPTEKKKKKKSPGLF